MRPGDMGTGYLGAQRDVQMKRNQEGHHLQERAKPSPPPPAPQLQVSVAETTQAVVCFYGSLAVSVRSICHVWKE